MSAARDFPPIADLAAIGDKRTVALIDRDATIAWMCVPRFDGDAVFDTLLDRRGGRFALAPTQPSETQRRYVPDTNVLQTTFRTSGGAVRVTDALALAGHARSPYTQLIRRIDGLDGAVELAWCCEPRCDYGLRTMRPRVEHGMTAFDHGDLCLSTQSLGAGEPVARGGALQGATTIAAGDCAALVLGVFERQPAELVDLATALARLDATVEHWRRWLSRCAYDGPWRAEVFRSVLALDLLVDDESGAIIAAATTSLPERVGGSRNWDYRYAWLRDANLTLEAMMRLGYLTQVQASMAWMFDAIDGTAPLLRPLYRADGSPRAPLESVDLEGYRGSRPVHVGNRADDQLQLGNWGDLLDATWRYVELGHVLHPRGARRVVEAVEFLLRVWRRPDCGLWELPDREQFTQSKLACWTALERACRLAERGQLPDARPAAWRAERERIRSFVASRCWSERHGAWTRIADGRHELDAAVLLAARGSFFDAEPERMSSTVDAILRELDAGRGLLYRDSAVRGQEGAFVACSFWAVEALARVGRVDDAAELMDTVVARVSDVGLLSEEIDPSDGAFLGNVPQALSHLALVNAADVVRHAAGEAPSA